ncbi:MAG: hypothetical protein IPF66_23925 [Holophagales bacterium]|nr:hypothetical protein [Holophagales bacterium]
MPGPGRSELSPLRAWALEQKARRAGSASFVAGEVEPADAPWLRAAGLEVALSEPGVPEDDMGEVLGVPSDEAG